MTRRKQKSNQSRAQNIAVNTREEQKITEQNKTKYSGGGQRRTAKCFEEQSGGNIWVNISFRSNTKVNLCTPKVAVATQISSRLSSKVTKSSIEFGEEKLALRI